MYILYFIIFHTKVQIVENEILNFFFIIIFRNAFSIDSRIFDTS